MVDLHNLTRAPGKKRKRRGRGTGSGSGNKSGRGDKGQRSRSGGRVRPGFEGGQTPLIRRLPKRGFTNVFKKEYTIINVQDLNRFPEGTAISPETFVQEGMMSKSQAMAVKILGTGDLTQKNLTVQAHAFSSAAQEKICALGGQVEVL